MVKSPLILTISLLAIVANFSSVTSAIAAGRSFYISQSGSDANDGRSTVTPWQSVSKINSGSFSAGDTINLRGGDTFAGCIVFNTANVPASQSANPLKVQNYGSGAATVVSNCPGKPISGTQGPRSAALTVDGVSGFDWNGPSLRGSNPVTPTQYGVVIENENLTTAASNITIENADISGFMLTNGATADSSAEVLVLGYSLKGACGPLDTVRILHDTLHGSVVTAADDSGISGYACGRNITNVLYQGNTVYNMGGRAAAPNGSSGNGIVANGVDGGVTANNVVHDNGANATKCGGPGGVWAFSANNIKIQYNEVYRMQPYPAFKSGCDWAAFDLDVNVTNSFIQYNYSHDNAGPGLLTYTGGNTAGWFNNTIRFNISQNDNALLIDGGGSIALNPASSLYVYNNTIYKGGVFPTQVPPSCWSTGYNGAYAAPVIIANNICVNASTDRWNDTRMVDGSGGATGLNTITMANNDYFNGGAGNTNYVWGSSTYRSLGAFQSGTWQETNSIASNPLLVGPGSGGTIGATAGPQPNPSGYRLAAGSPALGCGVTLTQAPYGLVAGTRDYFNNSVPNSSQPGFNIGAQN